MVRQINKAVLIQNKLLLLTKQLQQKRNKVRLDLSNYATKSEVKGATGTDTSESSKKTDLASLKSKVDNTEIDQLELFQMIEVS